MSQSHFHLGAKVNEQALGAKVHQALGELRKQIPQRSYRILYMHWIEGRTLAEIAGFLELPIEKVRVRHQRANHRFRRLLDIHTAQPVRLD